MANPIAYNAADAGVLIQIADAANGNLQQTPFLPVGWNLLTTITTAGLGKPQAILAGGTLPSNGASVVVLAIGSPMPAFLNYYTTANHTLASPIISGLLPPLPPPPPPLPLPTLDVGFQALYNRLRALIVTALTSFASSYPTLITCGIGGPAALAQLAAIDFRVGGTTAPGFLQVVGCYSFSTPPFVNNTTATVSVQTQLPTVYAGLFALTAQNDFFPTAPTPAMGYVPLGQQISIPAPLPAYDSPWYERSATYYGNAFAPSVARMQREAAVAASGDDAVAAASAGAAYDPNLAYVLAQFCAAASEAFQHPALSPSIPTGWTLLSTISNSAGQVMAVVYSRLSQVLVAFRGTSSFEETVQTFGNQNAQYVNFLAAPMAAGVVLQGAYNGYMALRQNFRQALAQVSGFASVSLILTGHDTGGWLALMAATDLMQGTGGTPTLPTLATPPQVYTFGTPTMGNIPFTNFFTTSVTSSVYQVARPADVVASLFIPGYMPIGTLQPVTGTTTYDDQTYHPVISYIQLLNPGA